MFWLTTPRQMEVCGHHLHLIPPLPVGEPAPEGSGLAGFFRCLGTTDVVPSHFYSKEEFSKFSPPERYTLSKSRDAGKLCRDLCNLLRSVVGWTLQKTAINMCPQMKNYKLRGLQHRLRSCINAGARYRLFRKVNQPLLSFRHFPWSFKKWCSWQWWGITINLWRSGNTSSAWYTAEKIPPF